jgi:predicted DCC family thiol-disulfide oxidoreductase YuxK
MAELTILFDGGCPLCLREVRFLEQRDRRRHPAAPRLAFVDIDAAGYDAAAHGGISYRDAMGRIHALAAGGEVLRDVEVFRRAYELIGLGWLYAPTAWPVLAPLVNALYALWASARLRITGRPSLDQLCAVRGGRCGFPAAGDRVAAGMVPPGGSPGLVRRADTSPAGGL